MKEGENVMDKKKYETPDMQVVEFSAEDIIRTSGVTPTPGDTDFVPGNP